MEDDWVIDEQKSAKFNAGILQTQRINKILDFMNEVKQNPLAYNVEYLDWNYNLWFNSINELYDEIDSYIEETESEIALGYRSKCEELMRKYLVREKIRNKKEGIGTQVNNQVWFLIKNLLENYERFVKRYGLKYQIIGAFKEKAGRI